MTKKKIEPETSSRFKRISLNVEPEMHKRIRVACAEKGIDMATELRRIILKHFPAPKIEE